MGLQKHHKTITTIFEAELYGMNDLFSTFMPSYEETTGDDDEMIVEEVDIEDEFGEEDELFDCINFTHTLPFIVLGMLSIAALGTVKQI
jgi:hypothetical protein